MFLWYKCGKVGFELFFQLCHRGWWRTPDFFTTFNERSLVKSYFAVKEAARLAARFAGSLGRTNGRQLLACPSLKNLWPSPLMQSKSEQSLKKFQRPCLCCSQSWEAAAVSSVKQFANRQSTWGGDHLDWRDTTFCHWKIVLFWLSLQDFLCHFWKCWFDVNYC